MHKEINEEIDAGFLHNITQSIVPNIEKFGCTTNAFRENCSGCETQIYKV